MARYLAQHGGDRGAMRNLFSDSWLRVLPTLRSLGFKDITPSSRPTGNPGEEDTWGKSFEGLGSAGDLEGRARAQNDTASEKTWRALGLHREWSLGFPRAGGEG